MEPLKGERGQATVEFALSLPLMAILIAVLIELGGVLVDQARLWNAAREAARVGAVDPDESAMKEAAEASGLSGFGFSVTPESTARRRGEPITVSLTYDPRSTVPLVGNAFERLELHSNVTMRIEQP